MSGLERLEAAARRQLALFEYPTRDWMLPGAEDEYHVVVLGAGPRACAVALGLLRERIGRILLIDTGDVDDTCKQAAVTGDAVWRRADFGGHEVSLGPLSFTAWLAAARSQEPRELDGAGLAAAWADYSGWLRGMLAVPVLPAAAVGEVRLRSGSLVRGGGGVMRARRAVVATTEADLPRQPLGDDAPAPGKVAWDDPGLVLGFSRLSAQAQAKLIAAARRQLQMPAAAVTASEWCWRGSGGTAALSGLATRADFSAIDDPALSLFGTAALGSVGPAALGGNLIRYGLPLLIAGIGRSLFLEDRDALFAAYQRFDDAERRA